jgi:hypothetical protein
MVLAIVSHLLPPCSGRRPRCRYLHSRHHRGAPNPYGIIKSTFGQKSVSVGCVSRAHFKNLVFWGPFLALLLPFAWLAHVSQAYHPASSDQYKNHVGCVLDMLPPNRAGQCTTCVRQVRECIVRIHLFFSSSFLFASRLLQSARRRPVIHPRPLGKCTDGL